MNFSSRVHLLATSILDIMMDFTLKSWLSYVMKDLTIHSYILRDSFLTLVKAENNVPCKRSTIKSIFAPSIHTNQQLECITLVHWTSAGIARLTTFKITLFLSSFSIQTYESNIAWVTYITFRQVHPSRRCLWSHFFMLSPFLHVIFTAFTLFSM